MSEKNNSLFISMPMAGKSAEEITEKLEIYRKQAAEKGYIAYSGYETSNSLLSPIECFAQSVWKLSKCGAIYMTEGWEEARGCKLEKEIAEAYGLDIFTYEDMKIPVYAKGDLVKVYGDESFAVSEVSDFIYALVGCSECDSLYVIYSDGSTDYVNVRECRPTDYHFDYLSDFDEELSRLIRAGKLEPEH